jgi:hypothetical protein
VIILSEDGNDSCLRGLDRGEKKSAGHCIGVLAHLFRFARWAALARGETLRERVAPRNVHHRPASSLEKKRKKRKETARNLLALFTTAKVRSYLAWMNPV